ncbi:MAG: hypothetical protein LBC17_03890 [Lactobacillaceae bacterium]|jgi:hypothetical protein|nr:hypothetical protein [Lactobacillaceae bacterium]
MTRRKTQLSENKFISIIVGTLVLGFGILIFLSIFLSSHLKQALKENLNSATRNISVKKSTSATKKDKISKDFTKREQSAIMLLYAKPILAGGLDYQQLINQNPDAKITLTYGKTGADASHLVLSSDLITGMGAYNYNSFLIDGDNVTMYNPPALSNDFSNSNRPLSDISTTDFEDGGVANTFSLKQAYKQIIDNGQEKTLKKITKKIIIDKTPERLANQYDPLQLEAARVWLSVQNTHLFMEDDDGYSPIYVQKHKAGEKIFNGETDSWITTLYPSDVISISYDRDDLPAGGTVWYNLNNPTTFAVNVFSVPISGVVSGPSEEEHEKAVLRFNEGVKEQFITPKYVIQLPVYSEEQISSIINRIVILN